MCLLYKILVCHSFVIFHSSMIIALFWKIVNLWDAILWTNESIQVQPENRTSPFSYLGTLLGIGKTLIHENYLLYMNCSSISCFLVYHGNCWLYELGNNLDHFIVHKNGKKWVVFNSSDWNKDFIHFKNIFQPFPITVR